METNSILLPPASPDFHGFETADIPQPLVIKVEGEGDEEEVKSVLRKQKMGRPRGKNICHVDTSDILEKRRRPDQGNKLQPPKSNTSPAKSDTSSKTTPKQVLGSSSRPQFYLLDNVYSSHTSRTLIQVQQQMSHSQS